MVTPVAVGICAAIAARGVVAWRDARARRRVDMPLDARIARAVKRAEAEAARVDAILARRAA